MLSPSTTRTVMRARRGRVGLGSILGHGLDRFQGLDNVDHGGSVLGLDLQALEGELRRLHRGLGRVLTVHSRVHDHAQLPLRSQARLSPLNQVLLPTWPPRIQSPQPRQHLQKDYPKPVHVALHVQMAYARSSAITMILEYIQWFIFFV